MTIFAYAIFFIYHTSMKSKLPLTSSQAGELLKQFKLRDTQARRSALVTLQASREPLSPQDVLQKIVKKNIAVNAVTIYRTLEAFEQCGLVHRHIGTGRYSLCTMLHHAGHHGLLHCHGCGRIEEFFSPTLCKIEHRIASSAHFAVSRHISELIGTCQTCTH